MIFGGQAGVYAGIPKPPVVNWLSLSHCGPHSFYFDQLCSSGMGSNAVCCFLKDVNGTLFNLTNISLFCGGF